MNQIDVARILWQKCQLQLEMCMNQMDPKSSKQNNKKRFIHLYLNILNVRI